MRLVRGLPSPGLLLVLAAGISCSGCRSPLPNRDPVGEPFPPVTGTSLAGEEVRLPPGEPAILLIGYVQEAQFDADRWLIGLQQVGPPVRVLEVPTVEGLFPRALASSIDEGMRSGIPSEDWASVVTVYGDGAEEIVRFTGDTRPRNMRVVLVDAGGVVRWFHDRGFSAGKLLELVGEAGGWRLEAGGG